MPDDRPVKVIRVVQNPILLPTGQVEPRTRVEFMVGGDGPFDLTVAEAEFSAEKIRQEMEKKAVEIRKLYAGR